MSDSLNKLSGQPSGVTLMAGKGADGNLYAISVDENGIVQTSGSGTGTDPAVVTAAVAGEAAARTAAVSAEASRAQAAEAAAAAIASAASTASDAATTAANAASAQVAAATTAANAASAQVAAASAVANAAMPKTGGDFTGVISSPGMIDTSTSDSNLDFSFRGSAPATGPDTNTVRLVIASAVQIPYDIQVPTRFPGGTGIAMLVGTPGVSPADADGNTRPIMTGSWVPLRAPNIIEYLDTTNVFNYTPTLGTLYSVVTLIGGGGGSAGSGRGAPANGGNGSPTAMAGRIAGGGAGSSNTSNGRGGGGVAQGLPGDEKFNGFNGGGATNTADGPGSGGDGGATGEGSGGPLGGVPFTDHENGVAGNSDAYGIGASGPSAVGPDGDGTDGHPSPGGGGGAKVRFKILNPAGTYQGTVGIGGLGSAATDRGRNGADGKQGMIQVEEFFQ